MRQGHPISISHSGRDKAIWGLLYPTVGYLESEACWGIINVNQHLRDQLQADVSPPRYTHSKVSKSLQTEGSGLLFKCKSPYVVYQLLRHLCKKRKTRAESTKQIICRQRWWSQTSHSYHYDSVMNYLQPQPPWDGTSLCSNLLPPLNWNIRQNNSSKSLEKKKRRQPAEL